MPQPLFDHLLEHLNTAAQTGLILLGGPPSAGKTATLRSLAQTRQLAIRNIGEMLSEQLLGLTERDRRLQVQELLEQVADEGRLVFLDNIEVLFEPALKQDPLSCLRLLARDRLVVAVWPGSTETGRISYATRNHPEYRDWPADGIVTVEAEPQQGSR